MWDLLATMAPRLPWRWFPELMWSWHWVPGVQRGRNGRETCSFETGVCFWTIHLQRLKKKTALKSSGFWNLQDWFLLLSFINSNAAKCLKSNQQWLMYRLIPQFFWSRLNPFSTLPCYGIEYWPKDAKLIQAQILRDQLTLWLFSSGITLPSYIGVILSYYKDPRTWSNQYSMSFLLQPGFVCFQRWNPAVNR